MLLSTMPEREREREKQRERNKERGERSSVLNMNSYMLGLEVMHIIFTFVIHWPGFIIWPAQPQKASMGNPIMVPKGGESLLLATFFPLEVDKVGGRRVNSLEEAMFHMDG